MEGQPKKTKFDELVNYAVSHDEKLGSIDETLKDFKKLFYLVIIGLFMLAGVKNITEPVKASAELVKRAVQNF